MTYQFNPTPAGYPVIFSFAGASSPPSLEDLGPSADDGPPAPEAVEPAAENALGAELPMESATQADHLVKDSGDAVALIDSESHNALRPPGQVPPAAEQRDTPDPKHKVCACAVSGSLLAVATLVPGQWSFQVAPWATRLFHLGGRSQDKMRKFAGEIYKFVANEDIQEITFCRTLTGSWTEGLDDETRIECLMMMVPQLGISLVDNATVAEWIIDTNPPAPENMPAARQGFAQARALELAQYVVAHRRDIDTTS